MKGNAEWEGVLIDIVKEKAPCLKIRGFWSDTASTYKAEKKKKRQKKETNISFLFRTGNHRTLKKNLRN